MSPKTSAKFTFDTEFQAGSDVVSNAARGRQRVSLTGDEVEQIRARAHAEGAQSTAARAAEALVTSVDGFAMALRSALDDSHDETETMRAGAVAIALAAARKIASAALDGFPAADVEGALREAMHLAIGEPRIMLRGAPHIVELLKDRVAEITAEEAYDGRVLLVADAGTAASDCRIEWRGGGAERSLAVIQAALDSLTDKRFTGSNFSAKG